MKIITLIENRVDKNGDYKSEHGLSFYIETESSKILFDTGKTDKFIENANKMKIDLEKIDYIVISHSHYDHANGVVEYIKEYKNRPKLIISKYFFENGNKYRCYKAKENRYIGTNIDEKIIQTENMDIRYIEEKITCIENDFYIFSNFERVREEINNESLIYLNENEEEIVDPFIDEIAIGIDTEQGLLILVGCSHPGIINIISSIIKVSKKPIYGIIGGSHLKEADKPRIDKTFTYLEDIDIKLLGFNHCTGEEALKIFEKNFTGFVDNRTGSVVELG